VNKELTKVLTKLKKDYSDSLPNVEEAGLVRRLVMSSPQLNYIMGGGVPLGRIIEFFGPESGGKEQPNSSRVLTPTGWTLMGNLKVGDKVCTPSGRVTNVTGVFPQGEKDVFEITLRDGSTTRAGRDHLWNVKSSKYSTRWARKSKNFEDSCLKTVTTEDLAKNINKSLSKYGKINSPDADYLELIQPQEFLKKSLPLDPYVLGLLLGDGCMTQAMTQFSSEDQQLIDSIKSILGFELSQASFYDWRIKSKGSLPAILKQLDLQGRNSYDKFIPFDYKWSSIEDRMNLLRGLLDTDGHIGKDVKHSGIEYSSSSKKLAEDVVDIVHSLGGTARIKVKKTSYTYKGEKKEGALSYRLHLALPQKLGSPFALERKKDLFLSKSRKTIRYQYIKSVEYVGKEECSCIMVDDVEHLYITDNFIPTHNTVISSYIGGQFQRRTDGGPKMVLFIDMEHSFEKKYAQVAGLSLADEDLIFVRPMNGEEAFTIMEELVATGQIGCIIYDSIAATPSAAEVEDVYGKSNFGATAKLFSQGLRKLNPYISRFNITLILLNQVRDNIGGWSPNGKPEDITPGGRAIKFYASWRAKVSKMEDIAIKKVVIGNVVKIRNVKNKVGIPKRSAILDLKYETGFDPDNEYIQFIMDLGIVKVAGAGWMSNDVWGWKGQGRDSLLTYLKANPEKFEDCKRIVNESFTKATVLDSLEADEESDDLGDE